MDKAFAYVCASAETSPRILKRYCRTVYELGYVPICPALSDTQYLSDESPDELRDLHSIALQKLARCRIPNRSLKTLVANTAPFSILDEYCKSHGMSVEIGFAEKRHIICTTLAGLAKIQEDPDVAAD